VDFKKEAVTARTKLVKFIEDLSEEVKLDEAEIIVSGGRGLGKPENFKLIKELADVLGAAVGSSRPPVDEGWISYSHQVGQDRLSQALYRLRHLGVSAASGRHGDIGVHNRHQRRPQCAHLPGGDLRDSGRPV
jgi:hypothetical protein